MSRGYPANAKAPRMPRQPPWRHSDVWNSIAQVSTIASEAGVAIQTIYNSIGAKRDVLSNVLDYAATGEHAPTPAPTFLLAQAEHEPDPRKCLDQLVDFWRDSRRRIAPFYRVLRQAAALDQEAADLERARAEERLRSYRSGAALFAERGALREGLSLDDAAVIIHATGHPDLYRFLVIEQNWTADHWATWVRSTLESRIAGSRNSPSTNGRRDLR